MMGSSLEAGLGDIFNAPDERILKAVEKAGNRCRQPLPPPCHFPDSGPLWPRITTLGRRPKSNRPIELVLHIIVRFTCGSKQQSTRISNVTVLSPSMV